MSDDVARAVGAGSNESVVIDGVVCSVRPLNLRELGELERECLKRYKRAYLETYAENLDLLPEVSKQELLAGKLEEVARWDVKDLPLKKVFEATKVPLTDAAAKWAVAQYGADALGNSSSDVVRRQRLGNLVVTALEDGSLSLEQYRAITGRDARGVSVGYVNWWITATFDGQIEMVYSCFRHNGITRDALCAELSRNPAVLVQITREIESLTAPTVGNTSDA